MNLVRKYEISVSIGRTGYFFMLARFNLELKLIVKQQKRGS